MQVGSVLGDRYELRSLLGEGAMASVYEAFDRVESRTVAIKVPRPHVLASPELRARFEREASAAILSDHPGIVRAFEIGRTDDGAPFLVTERAAGTELSEAVSPLPIPWKRAVQIGLQIARALKSLHDKGVIHRDLKPANIYLETDASGEKVKVLDLGVAKILDQPVEEGLTHAGAVYGTPEYMAPEQALGQEVDERADVYSLGVILYELIAGRRPYDGKAQQLLGQQLTKPLPPLGLDTSVAPPDLEPLLRTMLAAACAERPKMPEVCARLESILRSAVPSTPAPESSSQSEPARALESSNRFLPMLWVAAVSLGLGAGLAFFALKPAETGEAQVAEVVPSLPSPAPAEEEASVPSEPPVFRFDPDVPRTLDDLIALSRQHSSEPAVHLALAEAYLEGGDYASAVLSVTTALGLDPSLNRDLRLQKLLEKTAQMQSSTDASFRLLRGPMGQEGADLLYRLSLDGSVRATIRAQANQALSSPEVRENLSLPLSLALSLAAARSCKELLPLLEKAKLFGDERSLSRLLSLQANLSCRRPGQPCYPCLRRGPELEEAISAIRGRMAPAPSAEP